MKNKISLASIAAAIIFIVIGIWTLPVAVFGIYLDVTTFSGSLSALISEIILFVTCVLAVLQIIAAVFIFKKRAWAHILAIVIAIFVMLASLINADGKYSVTAVYLLILLLLMAGAKDFKKA